jgi:hypothetical protein
VFNLQVPLYWKVSNQFKCVSAAQEVNLIALDKRLARDDSFALLTQAAGT